jgi:hypothetical protein
MPIRISRKRAVKPGSALRAFVAKVVDTVVNHVVIALAAAAVAAGAVFYAYARHIMVAPDAPTLRDFSGTWWINVDGKSGEMTIRQTSDRRVEGTYKLDGGTTGVLKGLHDGYSFYNVVFDGSDHTRMFLESASVKEVDHCLQVERCELEIVRGIAQTKAPFSARGCE